MGFRSNDLIFQMNSHIQRKARVKSTFLFLSATLWIPDKRFEANVMVALTCNLVMYTLYVSVSDGLPVDSQLKLIDVWLLHGKMTKNEVQLYNWRQVCPILSYRDCHAICCVFDTGFLWKEGRWYREAGEEIREKEKVTTANLPSYCAHNLSTFCYGLFPDSYHCANHTVKRWI